jgi:hypothetical protein
MWLNIEMGTRAQPINVYQGKNVTTTKTTKIINTWPFTCVSIVDNHIANYLPRLIQTLNIDYEPGYSNLAGHLM